MCYEVGFIAGYSVRCDVDWATSTGQIIAVIQWVLDVGFIAGYSVRCDVDWANYGRTFRATDRRSTGQIIAVIQWVTIDVDWVYYSRVFSEV